MNLNHVEDLMTESVEKPQKFYKLWDVKNSFTPIK